MRFTHWTDERVEVLKAMWADGVHCSVIAAELGGISTNAVIGKAHRLGLPPHKDSNQSRMAAAAEDRVKRPRIKPPPVPRSKVTNPFGLNGVSKLTAHRKTVALPDMPPDVGDNPVTLMELQDHHCRWPLGDPGKSDFRFCGGERQDGEPYCTRHCRIAYRPLEVRERPVWLQRNPRQKAAAI